MQEANLAQRASRIVTGYRHAESTGSVKGRTFLLDRMAALTRMAPLAAVVLLSACNDGPGRPQEEAGLTSLRIRAAMSGGAGRATWDTAEAAAPATSAVVAREPRTPVLVGYDPSGVPAAAGRDAPFIARAEAMVSRAPLGAVVRWANPDTGASASYQPVREGYTAMGGFCREYRVRRSEGEGGHATSFTTACISPGGSLAAIGISQEPRDGDFHEVTDHVPGHGGPLPGSWRL